MLTIKKSYLEILHWVILGAHQEEMKKGFHW